MSNIHLPEVEDPTDFPSEKDAPGLRGMDNAFRCAICSEIFDAPMMLHCGHTFCSYCIRQTLRDTHECPHCRTKAEEIQLLKNVTLEELASTWRRSRKFILETLEDLRKAEAARSVPECHSPKKKRKLDNMTSSKQKRQAGSPSSNSESSSSNIKKSTSEIEIIDDSEEDVGKWVASSDAEENEAEASLTQTVTCPMCSKAVLFKDVNEHIDNGCATQVSGRTVAQSTKESRNSTKDAWSNMLKGPPSKNGAGSKGKGMSSTEGGSIEKLPRPPYSILKEKKIREMLAGYDLATTGSKEQLVARHSQFVLLFNSNLDRPDASRKSLVNIRKELKKWEETQTVKKQSVDDARAYLKNHESDFKRHVRAARASASAIQKNTASSEEANATVTSSHERLKQEVKASSCTTQQDG